MSYQLQANETLRDALRRVADEELDGAIRRLNAGGESDRVSDVHEARKHIKKTRSALRLVRHELGDKAYRKQNARLRKAGGRFSGIRDAQVAVITLAKLAPGEFPGVEARLEARRDEASAQAAGDDTRVQASVDGLLKAQRLAGDWPLPENKWRAVGPGLRRGYQRGARAYGQLGRKPTVDELHEWRKRVKDLWYHLRILTPVWPDPLEALAEQAHQLSERLGDDHDLAMLRATLTDDFDADHETAALTARIDDRRRELQRDARRLGGRLYVDKPRAFERRMRAYWEAWREETAKDTRRSAAAAEQAAEGNGHLQPPALGSVEPLRVDRPAPPTQPPGQPQLAAPAAGTEEVPPASTPSPPPSAGLAEPQLEAPAPGTVETAVAAAPAAAEPAALGLAEPQLDPPALGTVDGGEDVLPAPEVPVQAEDTVYGTRTGARFHRRECPLLPGAPRALSREEAVSAGLRPCRTCRP